MASLEQHVEVETPEQVVFEYTIAGLGSRAVAAIVDALICIGLLLAFIFLISLVPTSRDAAARLSNSEGWVYAALAIGQFLIFWGYYVLWEALWNGQTPGKRWMKLRVVQDGGYAISFQASAVRNLVRMLDMSPPLFYVVGMLSVLISSSGKRLGDYVAGTIVVKERTVAVPVGAGAAGAAAGAAVVTQLSEDEYALLERYLARRDQLAAQRRDTFDEKLALRFGDRLRGEAQALVHVRLQKLYESERALRARGVASPSDTGAAREQHSIVAAGSDRWKEFEARLANVNRTGIHRLSEDEVAGFVAHYRELSTELARLRTAARGRQMGALDYLSRLVAGGHNLLYRQRQLAPRLVWEYLTVNLPREIRRSARPILLAALLLFGPMAIAHVVVVRHPGTAREFIPAHMIERAETALERERRGGGYLGGADRIHPAQMASEIMTNNIGVVFRAFVFGMTAGIGTLLVLVTNGIFIGGIMGLFQSEGALHLILAFVGPHGVLELAAICIGAGGGLLVGSAFILPGAMTRREALVVRGKRAIRLIAAASLFLVIAGVIEGFISPRNLPLAASFSISAVTAILALLYMFSGRGGELGAPEEEHGYRDDLALRSR